MLAHAVGGGFPGPAMPPLPPFSLERFFAKYEFHVEHHLCASDPQALSTADVLALATEDEREAYGKLDLGYTESAGNPDLRKAIAEHHYGGVGAEEVVCVVPEEGIYLTMLALAERCKQAHAVVTAPAYQSLFQVLESAGWSVDFWKPRFGDDHHARFDVADLESLVQEGTRLIVVNFPHNPTGALPTPDEWQAIASVASSAGALVFSDEMYRGLELRDHTRLPSMADVLGAGAVALSGLSKTYGLPGLRVGWLAVQDAKLRDRIRELKDYTTICGSAPSEFLGTIAVRNTALLQERVRAQIRANVHEASAFFAHPDRKALFAWPEGGPVAGTVLFPRLQSHQDASPLCEHLARCHGVLILPAAALPFDATSHFRIGLGRSSASLTAGLAALGAALADADVRRLAGSPV